MIKITQHPPLIGFAAWSGTGKTTLIEKLIPLFREKGLRIGVIKHAHHDFDIDHKGKDSYKLRKAGATDTIVASAKRWALIHENDTNSNTGQLTEPDLASLLAALTSTSASLKNAPLDLILIEGFKHEAIPRIELSRTESRTESRVALNKTLLYPEDKEIIAIATDASDNRAHPITRLNINEPSEIVAFITDYFHFHTSSSTQ